MRSVVLVAFCSVWMSGFGVELPSYLRKCSKSDPNLNQCIIDNANFAVPEVVRGMCLQIESYAGETRFNWPLLSPLLISELELPGSDFTVILRDVRLDGLENFKMTDIRQVKLRTTKGSRVFSLDKRSHVVIGTVPLYSLTADYTIQDKGLLSRSILGGGKLRASLEQNTLQYNFDLDRIEKNGETHLKYAEDVRLSLKTKRIFYNFKDFFVSDAANFDEFIRKHKEIVEYRLRPAIEQVTLNYLQHVLNNFVETVPLKDIFDP
ncbi:hypothetical protein Trydic_g9005 [Trypoxylus dichotomus]